MNGNDLRAFDARPMMKDPGNAVVSKEMIPVQVRLNMTIELIERALFRVHRTNQKLYTGISELERYPASDNGLSGQMDDLVRLSRELDETIDTLLYRLGD